MHWDVGLLVGVMVVATGCASDDVEAGESSGSGSATEASTSADASSTSTGEPATTSSTSDDGSTGLPPETSSSETGAGSSTGEPLPPDVPPGAFFRGVVELSDGSLLPFDASPEFSVNQLDGRQVCSAQADVDGHDIEVDLIWPDTATLMLGEQPWSIVGADGPQLHVSIDGPLGDEVSLSTAGWVWFVNNGDDDPPTVAGAGTLDLDPADDGDLLQSMTEIEFRCPL